MPDIKEMEKLIACMVCAATLSSSFYSKSQINKLEHGKLSAVKCIKCTTVSTLQSEFDSQSKAVLLSKTSATTPQFDPSAQYISDPMNTPIVKDAVFCANLIGLDYPVCVGSIEGWRTVVKMAVRGTIKKNKSGKESVITTIGLFKPGTHKVVECIQSQAHHPQINRALSLINEACARIKLQGYFEGDGHINSDSNVLKRSFLKYLILALARSTNTVQLTVVWNTEPSGNTVGEIMLKNLVATLLKYTESVDDGSDHLHSKDNNGVSDNTNRESNELSTSSLFHSIWVNYNPASRYSNAITGREKDSWRLLYGKKYIKEVVHTDMGSCGSTTSSSGGVGADTVTATSTLSSSSILPPPQLRFPPYVFRQANLCAFTKIIVNIRQWIRNMTGCNNGGNSQHNNNNDVSSNRDKNTATTSAKKLRCVELYGGVGTIGLNCLDLFSVLSCSDENPHNKACFDATVAGMLATARLNAAAAEAVASSSAPTSTTAAATTTEVAIKNDKKHKKNKKDFHGYSNSGSSSSSHTTSSSSHTTSSSNSVSNSDVNRVHNLLTDLPTVSYCTEGAAAVAARGGLSGYDIVIVDPPRKGLDDEVICALLRSNCGGNDSNNSRDDNSGNSNSNNKNSGSMKEAIGLGKKVYFGEEAEDNDASTITKGSDSNNSSSEQSLKHQRLIYVSCGFPAFKRDLVRLTGDSSIHTMSSSSSNRNSESEQLTKSVDNRSSSSESTSFTSFKRRKIVHDTAYATGSSSSQCYWKLIHMEGHVLFPGSDHVETLAIFDRYVF